MHPLLETGVVADVVLDGGWRQHVEVTSTEPVVELRSINGLPLLPGTLTWCPAALEWRQGNHSAHLDGVLTAHDGKFMLTPSHDAHDVQRREYVRVPANLPAAVITSELRLLTRAANVSLGGVMLTGANDLKIDDRLQFALDLGDGTVAVTGRVVSGSPEGTRGIQFDDLDPTAERALARFIADRQRAAARVSEAPDTKPGT